MFVKSKNSVVYYIPAVLKVSISNGELLVAPASAGSLGLRGSAGSQHSSLLGVDRDLGRYSHHTNSTQAENLPLNVIASEARQSRSRDDFDHQEQRVPRDGVARHFPENSHHFKSLPRRFPPRNDTYGPFLLRTLCPYYLNHPNAFAQYSGLPRWR